MSIKNAKVPIKEVTLTAESYDEVVEELKFLNEQNEIFSRFYDKLYEKGFKFSNDPFHTNDFDVRVAQTEMGPNFLIIGRE